MNNIPSFGVGNFRRAGKMVIDSVCNALDAGYRDRYGADICLSEPG